jgi:hypothetical protein
MFIRTEIIEGCEDHYYIYYYESDALNAPLLMPKIRAYIDFDKWSSIEEFAQYIYDISMNPDYYINQLSQAQRDYNLLLSKCYSKRRENYPAAVDQLDMIYHEIKLNNSITADGNWFNLIKNVKESYPKPPEVL